MVYASRVRPAYVALWQSVFVLALALELPIVGFAAPAGRRARALLGSLLGNALTHPALWFLWPRLLPATPALLVGEACAIGVEGAAIWLVARVSPRRAVAIAAAANLYSGGVGELVMRVFGTRLSAFWYGP